MQIQKCSYSFYQKLHKGIAVHRIIWVYSLCILIWLSGSLTSISALTSNVSGQVRQAGTANARPMASRTFHKVPSPTPLHPHTITIPMLKNLPPIIPFPPSLPQELILLQTKYRLFYHGNPQMHEIALTFDDGPNPPYTSQILAILQHYGINATFFCVGRQAQIYPDLVRQEFLQGNPVGNHTWAHANMPYLSTASIIWQLTTASDAIEHATGVRPTFFRPPYGAFNATVLTQINLFGMTTFLWNVDPRDWSRPGTNMIVARVLSQTQPGSIILLHDGGGDRSQTVAALPIIIEWYQQHGFRFVTLQQLIEDVHTNPVTVPAMRETSPSPRLEAWRRRWQIWYSSATA